MNFLHRVKIPAQVLARQIGEETVILDLDSGTYFGLDPVGARMWSLMAEGLTLSNVRDKLLLEYDVDINQLEADLDAFLRTLQENGLVLITEPREIGDW